MNISKFVAPEIIFGRGSLSQLGESVIRIGATSKTSQNFLGYAGNFCVRFG